MSLIYFTDRDLGKRFPEILRTAGLHVERHSDHFEPDTPDDVWLSAIGRKGWVGVTHDSRIRYKPNEKRAVLENNVALLVVIGSAPFPDLASAFVTIEPKIRSFVAAHERPWIAKVYRASPKALLAGPRAPGRVELWHPRG